MPCVTETGRLYLVALMLSLAGSAPALAYDANPSVGVEPPCSALCRSWMGLGAADAPAEPAAQQPATPTAPDRSPLPAAASEVGPIPRKTEKPRSAAQAKVPLPPPRPRDPAQSPIAAAEPPPPPVASPLPVQVTERPPASEAGPAVSVAPAPPAPPPPLGRVEAPAAPRPVVEPSPSVAPIGAEEATARPVPQPIPPSRGTPWSVRLGFYAVLAGLVGWAFLPRRTGPQRDEATARRAPRRSRSVRTRLDGRVQYPAVDAL